MADNVELNAGSGGAICATDDCGAAGHTQITKLAISTNGSATLIPATANGILIDEASVSGHHLVAAATDNAASVKAATGTLRGFDIFNASAVPIYLKFHNTAGTPTAGSGVVRTFGIQAGTRAFVNLPGHGLSFATGIGITLVRDLADSGTTATAANDAVGEIFYE